MNFILDRSNLLNACEACKIAEAEYIKNPRDADNLTRWGGAMIKMYEDHDQDTSLDDAILKLKEALFLDPYHHEALWCLGEAFSTKAPEYNDKKRIDYYAKKAVRCFQRAFDLDPSNEMYRRSFEVYSEDLEEDFASDEQLIGITESSPSSSTKELRDELKIMRENQERTNLIMANMRENQERANLTMANMRENQERTNLIMANMHENQEMTNLIMANMLSFIQNRFSGEDVNAIIQAARQIEGLDGVLDTLNGMSL